jgi:hypothetical protein
VFRIFVRSVRHADGDNLADIAGGVGVAIHFVPEFVELRAPRLEARTLNAEDGLRAIEIGAAERASRQSIQTRRRKSVVRDKLREQTHQQSFGIRWMTLAMLEAFVVERRAYANIRKLYDLYSCGACCRLFSC